MALRLPSRPTAILSQTASRQYASASVPPIPLGSLKLPEDYIPPTQPPSARRPELRKSQLLRSYTALLRSTPLILFFQHNSLMSLEWVAVRRELRAALSKVPLPAVDPSGDVPVDISSSIHLQVIRTRVFNIACKIVEFFDAEAQPSRSNAYAHDLSATAYETISKVTVDETSAYGQLNPLLVGPVAALTIPVVSPAHLAAVLSVLAPSPPAFPAPSRKKNPSYYEPMAQNGLHKLILVGGRIEGRVFDHEGVKWVGGIGGGVDSLRAQLVAMLQSAGLGLTTALEGNSKGLWLALEGRRTQLEEESEGAKKEETSGMDFAPYQSSPPENNRPFSPPRSSAASPRTSLDNHNRRPFSPPQRGSFASPPPLQHPQPQRSWQPALPASGATGYSAEAGGHVSEFDTSLGIRLDYEACLAYLGLPPLGAIVLLILERKSDFVRFHAWQSSLLFTVVFIIHLIFSWSTFLSWIIFIADLCLMGWLALRAYRDADTLDRFEVPVFGQIASRILDDE
ncbi:hypothetical protein GGR54DRAFT_632724 [Hypoxylon sp. NC1633]|nr:hypothetical protein GGR54DRAFT_632724 [Hypoxylon sp. NC1633]